MENYLCVWFRISIFSLQEASRFVVKSKLRFAKEPVEEMGAGIMVFLEGPLEVVDAFRVSFEHNLFEF